jgi:hypothetical protein
MKPKSAQWWAENFGPHVNEEGIRLLAAMAEIAQSLIDNVMARRDLANGCCDWSCDLCAPAALDEVEHLAMMSKKGGPI